MENKISLLFLTLTFIKLIKNKGFGLWVDGWLE